MSKYFIQNRNLSLQRSLSTCKYKHKSLRIPGLSNFKKWWK